MKKFIITSIFAVLAATMTTVRGQDRPEEYLGLPGDNLNLYAVMSLFQESETLEGFERKLNDENSRINNLDLNGDNLIDYIKVMEFVDGNVHTIVLRDVLGLDEYQDVAVFVVEKYKNGSVRIQLIGDEALYGKNYIIEPNYADNGETPNPGYTGTRRNVTVVTTNYYDISFWPVVRFIYRPGYVVWHSSWYWGYYPDYWHPWNPWYWDYYYGYYYNWYPHYYRYYHHSHNHYYSRYDSFYYNGVRTHSQHVFDRIRDGHYQPTYSHPEMRREGEALYTRTNPDRNVSRRDDSPATVEGRRTSAGSTVDRSGNGNFSGGERRSTSTATRPEYNNSSNSNGSRRSTGTVYTESTETRSSSQAGTTSRSNASGNRQVATGQSRPSYSTGRTVSTGNSRSESNNGTVTTHRSSTSVSERTVSRPEPSRSSGAATRSTTSDRPSYSRSSSAPRSEASRASSSSSSSRASSSSSRSSSQASRSSSQKSSSESRSSIKSSNEKESSKNRSSHR